MLTTIKVQTKISGILRAIDIDDVLCDSLGGVLKRQKTKASNQMLTIQRPDFDY